MESRISRRNSSPPYSRSSCQLPLSTNWPGGKIQMKTICIYGLYRLTLRLWLWWIILLVNRRMMGRFLTSHLMWNTPCLGSILYIYHSRPQGPTQYFDTAHRITRKLNHFVNQQLTIRMNNRQFYAGKCWVEYILADCVLIWLLRLLFEQISFITFVQDVETVHKMDGGRVVGDHYRGQAERPSLGS